MRFSKYFDKECIPEWRKAYVDYQALKRQLMQIKAATAEPQPRRFSRREQTMRTRRATLTSDDELDRPTQTLNRLYAQGSEEEKQFVGMLNSDLKRVSSFYNEKEKECKEKLRALRNQVEIVEDYGHAVSALRLEDKRSNLFFRWFSPILSLAPRLLPRWKSDHLRHQMAKNRLKTAIVEFYRELTLLKSFRSLNYETLEHIIKKFEKVAGWKVGEEYMDKIKRCHWCRSKGLDELASAAEELFVREFYRGNKEYGLRKLQAQEEEENHTSTAWRVGAYIGASIPLLFESFAIVQTFPSDMEPIPHRHFHVQIYACFVVPILFILGVSVNMMIWKQYRISYKFIFDLDVRSNLDHREFAELPAFMLFLLSLCMYLDFSQTLERFIPSHFYPLLLFTLLMSILLCPANIFYRKARRWLCISLARITMSYLLPVQFRDFFIADELNSLSYSFWTFSYFVCAYTQNWAELDTRCHVTHMWITPFLASLPPWWRFLQCIRRYQDSSEDVHLVNAFKYVSTIVATFATGIWRFHSASPMMDLVWILTSMVNSTYTSIWDIRMDWGLLQSTDTTAQHFLLRPNLVFQPWVYYIAAAVNIILRFAWTLNAAGLTFRSDALNLITALLEAYRRLQWNVFRLENQHLDNCSSYRAINEIQLPFATAAPAPEDETIRRRPRIPSMRVSKRPSYYGGRDFEGTSDREQEDAGAESDVSDDA